MLERHRLQKHACNKLFVNQKNDPFQEFAISWTTNNKRKSIHQTNDWF